MASEIQTLFNKYQQKYPLYNREAIIDLMFERHVITKDEREQLKNGSVFLLKKQLLTNNDESSYVEIFGGNFNITDKKTTLSKTSFNRKIEPTCQSNKQGDCWLLSDINSLYLTEWGRQKIYNAIIPDEDGSGGVTIKLKGSPIKQKEFHFTARQIENAKKTGLYSDGDDDMIAFELAVEHTFREMVRRGMAKQISDAQDDYGSYLYNGVKTDKFEQYPISELLDIRTKRIYIDSMFAQKSGEQDTKKLFNWIKKNNEDVSIVLGFDNHAYSIKNFNYGENVTLTDPYNSKEERVISWDYFVNISRAMIFSFKTPAVKQQFEKILPPKYEENHKKFDEAEVLYWQKIINAINARTDSLKQSSKEK